MPPLPDLTPALIGALVQMHPHHGHGEIGAQHDLATQGVRGHIGAGADVLAIEVQQRVGGLQHVGFDRQRPGALEELEQPFRLGANFSVKPHRFRLR